MNNINEIRVYDAKDCCVFRKTKEEYGGLSNMASGFPLLVNSVNILSSEALYQACRFPHLPEIQEKIIKEKSPMSAKMVSKPYRNDSRSDWEDKKVDIMKWCLKIKLAQNFLEFGKLLESTFNKQIVEDSSKDNFWGTIRDKENVNILRGNNILGRLLVGLRKYYNENRYTYKMFVIEPLEIPNFKLFGQDIKAIDERENFISIIKNNFYFNKTENFPTIKSAEIQIITENSKENITLSENSEKIDKNENLKKKKSIKKNEDQDLLFIM